jgi:hypothetical protein
MSDWHSIQYETQYRMASRIHDAALGRQGHGATRLAVRRLWRGLVVRFAATNARRLEDRSAPSYEVHPAQR